VRDEAASDDADEEGARAKKAKVSDDSKTARAADKPTKKKVP